APHALAAQSALAVLREGGKYGRGDGQWVEDRKSTRLNSSHVAISYAVFCLKKKIVCGVERVPDEPVRPFGYDLRLNPTLTAGREFSARHCNGPPEQRGPGCIERHRGDGMRQ